VASCLHCGVFIDPRTWVCEKCDIKFTEEAVCMAKLPTYDQAIKNVEEAILTLRRVAYAEGFGMGKFEAGVERLHTPYGEEEFPEYDSYIDTPQQRRDEIVERAKKDADRLQRQLLSEFRIDFVVNLERRTVVALKRRYASGLVHAKGIAKCAPTDCFNASIGRAIALRRALGLEVPAEYYNAPQPEEVRVGDVVGYPFDTEDDESEIVVKVAKGSFYYEGGGFDEISALFEKDKDGPEYDPRIIDDSREEVGG
jgi:hypothetical protein